MFLINHLKRVGNIQKVFLQNRSVHDYLKLNISGESVDFPYVWLRDNCQCEQCFHGSAKSRILEWSKFDLNVKPKEISQDANSVKLKWSDGHISIYKLSWLMFRSFSRENKSRYTETLYRPTKKTWNSENFQEIFTKHDYNQILKSDTALYDWLYNLAVYGVALIQGTPDSETAVDAVLEKVAFPKRTHYGKKFVVQNVPNTSNVAYLSSNLQMHTDLPYYDYAPGSNLLHCLVQTDSQGGANLLSDGHFVAQYMKEQYSDQYRLLTETEVEWSDVGEEHEKEFYKLNRSPVIVLDMNKSISKINFSVPQRGSYFPGPIEHVVPWYEAYTLFLKLNHRFAANFKTKPGEIIVFDNLRLLHGRKTYTDSGKNIRKLMGAYLDWDEIYSKLRCLTLRLKNEDGM